MAHKREIPVYYVDAFATEPFEGNPAAVCLVRAGMDLSAAERQKIASELNLATTAFVEELSASQTLETDSTFVLRWFNPMAEMPMCGHATVAAASVIFGELGNPSSQLSFETMRGVLVATKGADGAVALGLPLNPPSEGPLDTASPLVQAIVGTLPVAEVRRSPTTRYYLIRLADGVTREQLESFAPDFPAMLRADGRETAGGAIVTVKTEGPYDFVSRFFNPWGCVNEDPVCGAAHTVMAPYWSQVLGKDALSARQVSRRGGDLGIRLANGRMEVSGRTRLVLCGKLLL